MKFPKPFRNDVQVGDSITYDFAEGMSVLARVVHDDDMRPEEFDCYDEEQVAAWYANDWEYCGVVVELFDGECKHYLGSLWGIDLHLTDKPGADSEYLTEIASDLLNKNAAEIAHHLRVKGNWLLQLADVWDKVRETSEV